MSAVIFPPRPSVLVTAAYENILHCRFSPAALKIKYLTVIAGCASDAQAKLQHDLVRSNEKRRGPTPLRLMPTEGLGAFVKESTFIDTTATAFGMSVAKFKNAYDAWIRYHDKVGKRERVTETERLRSFEFHSAKVPARQDGEIWLFRNPRRSRDPFDRLINPLLGARLGLRVGPHEIRLTFGFQASHVNAPAEPRFPDAVWEYLPLWHWSGKTRPLPGTPAAMPGLSEIIADPPEIRDINRPVVRIRVVKP